MNPIFTISTFPQEVEHNSPSFEAGLRAGDLITHVNDESVQSLLHPQVVHLLSSGTIVNIRAVPLDKTSIKEGSRRKGNPGKMARRSQKKRQQQQHQRERDKAAHDSKKKGRNLLRRLSNKKTDPIFPLATHIPHLPPGRQQFTPLNRSCSSGEAGTPLANPHHVKLGRSPPITVPWSPDSSQAGSSTSSSPSSSAPNSPATHVTAGSAGAPPHFGRPSSLHVVKHKKSSLKSPHRRKSVHNFPLSPLARTPSPSSQAAAASSPARSPSPLALPISYQVGASNQPQQTIPAHHHHPTPACKKALHAPSPIKTVGPSTSSHISSLASSTHTSLTSDHPPKPPTSSSKAPLGRPKSCEPGSPVRRRTSSPERLHPSSAQQKGARPKSVSSGPSKVPGSVSSRACDRLPPPHRKVSLQERSSSFKSQPEPPWSSPIGMAGPLSKKGNIERNQNLIPVAPVWGQ